MMNNNIYEVSLLNDWDETVKTWIVPDKEIANQIKEKVDGAIDIYRYRVEIFQHDIITDIESFNVKERLGNLYYVQNKEEKTIIDKEGK